MSCNTYSPSGSKFSARLLSPEQAYNKVMTLDQRIGYETNTLNRRNAISIRTSLNNLVSKLNTVDPTLYGAIRDRVNTNTLSPTEFADFVEWSGYSDQEVLEISTLSWPADSLVVTYELLEYYLDPNFATQSSSNACATLVNKLANVVGFLSAGAKLISELMNGAAAFIARLMSWKTLMQNMVDELRKRILAQIENFITRITGFAFQMKESIGRFMKRAEKVKQFLSDLSIENIKKKIEEIIAKIGGQFEEITAENMLHILMVICQLIESITNFMQAPLDALKAMFSAFTLSQFNLTQMTYQNMSHSVSRGLARMDPREAEATVNDAINGSYSAYDTSYVRNPNFTEEEKQALSTLMATGSVSYGGGTLSHDDGIMQGEANGGVSEGYKRVLASNPLLYVIVLRVMKQLNKSFTITSAYRSTATNASKKGAKKSLHMSCMAIDVWNNSMTTDEWVTFIEIASREGAGGLQYYPQSTFTHIDLRGAPQTWSVDGMIPSEIRAALNRHQAGKGGPSVEGVRN